MRGVERVLLEVEGAEKDIREALKPLTGISAISIEQQNENRLRFSVESKSDMRKEIARAIIGKNLGLLEIQSDKVTLEDIFLDLTTKEEGA
jgi:hypothetical protein